MMAQRIGEFIINLLEQWCAYAVLIGIAVVILLGLIFIILRKTTYGEMLMSAGFCMGILTLLLCASGLGLPMLMDPARCSIYYVYLLILTLTVLMDGILYLIFMRRLFTIPRNVLSFILTVSIVGSMIHQGMIKMPGFGRILLKKMKTRHGRLYQQMMRHRWGLIMAGITRQLASFEIWSI